MIPGRLIWTVFANSVLWNPMLTSHVTSEGFYRGLQPWTQMNYQHSLIKHEPHGEAASSLHGIVYPQPYSKAFQKWKLSLFFPWEAGKFLLILISAEKTKGLGLAYDDSPFWNKDFAVRLFAKSQKILLKRLKPKGETHQWVFFRLKIAF